MNSPAQEAVLVAAHEIEEVCRKHGLPLLCFISFGQQQTLVVNHLLQHAQNREIMRDNFSRTIAILESHHP